MLAIRIALPIILRKSSDEAPQVRMIHELSNQGELRLSNQNCPKAILYCISSLITTEINGYWSKVRPREIFLPTWVFYPNLLCSESTQSDKTHVSILCISYNFELLTFYRASNYFAWLWGDTTYKKLD